MAVNVPSPSEPITDKMMRPTWHGFLRDLLRLTNGKLSATPTSAEIATALAALLTTQGQIIRRGAAAPEALAAQTANTFIGGDGTDVTTRTAAQVKTSLGIPTSTTTNAIAKYADTAGALANSGVTIDVSNLLTGAVSFRSRTFTIADDAATSFTMPNSAGATIIIAGFTTTDSGIIAARPTSSVASLALAVGSNVAVSTGVLAGTTGADGKLTLSPHTDSALYVENRLGFSWTGGLSLFHR